MKSAVLTTCRNDPHAQLQIYLFKWPLDARSAQVDAQSSHHSQNLNFGVRYGSSELVCWCQILLVKFGVSINFEKKMVHIYNIYSQTIFVRVIFKSLGVIQEKLIFYRLHTFQRTVPPKNCSSDPIFFSTDSGDSNKVFVLESLSFSNIYEAKMSKN